MKYQVVLINRKKMIDMIMDFDGDINDPINKFYIELAGKRITIKEYCSEEDVFTCVEFPEYIIPSKMISCLCTNKVSSDIEEEYTITEMATIFNCSKQNISKIYNRAIKKIKKFIIKENITTMECLYV